jgi:ribosome-associated protein
MRVTQSIHIPDREIIEAFIRSPGPGGQNVNKVATAVQLSFDVRQSDSLPDEVKTRLIRLAGSRMTTDGVLMIRANRFRTQDRNRQDARERLIALIRKALERPRKRVRTRPSAASRARRLDGKRRRGRTKKLRKTPAVDSA